MQPFELESPRESCRRTILRRGNRTETILWERAGFSWVEKRLLPFADVLPERIRLASEARMHLVCAGPGVVPLRDESEERRARTVSSTNSFSRMAIFGWSLRHWVKHENGLTSLPVARIGSDLCRVLARLHARRDRMGRPLGLVHRDVTLDNVLIDERSRPWLTDLGLMHASLLRPLAEDELLQGTRLLLAPELERDEQPTSASDVYQLGLLLFFLCRAPGDPNLVSKPPLTSTELVREARHHLRLCFGHAIADMLHDLPERRPSAATVAPWLEQLERDEVTLE